MRLLLPAVPATATANAWAGLAANVIDGRAPADAAAEPAPDLHAANQPLFNGGSNP